MCIRIPAVEQLSTGARDDLAGDFFEEIFWIAKKLVSTDICWDWRKSFRGKFALCQEIFSGGMRKKPQGVFNHGCC